MLRVCQGNTSQASCQLQVTQFDWSHSQASPSSSFHHLRCAKLEVDGLGTFIILRVDSEGVSTKRDSRGKQKSCHLLTKRKKLYRWETCSFSGQLLPLPPCVHQCKHYYHTLSRPSPFDFTHCKLSKSGGRTELIL